MKENKVTRENSSQISQKHTNSLAVAWQPIKEVQKKKINLIPVDWEAEREL